MGQRRLPITPVVGGDPTPPPLTGVCEGSKRSFGAAGRSQPSQPGRGGPAKARLLTGIGCRGPKVGDPAPDFTLPAATKAGVNPAPLKLSDLQGQTVVIAFFPKARTGG